MKVELLNIHTERLHIRELGLADLFDFHFYRSNPEVTRYQGFDCMNMEEAETFIKENSTKYAVNQAEWLQYGIEKKGSHQLIGDCAIKLNQDHPQSAEIGITLSPLEQQKGYAKEVLLHLLCFLFDKKGIHRVVETVDAENTASIKLLRSAGFRHEGDRKDNILFKGKWVSEFEFALFKHEWESRKLNKEK